MTRKEQLKFCQICTNKKVSFEKGIICSLTGEHAAFEKNCPDFIENEKLKKDISYKKKKVAKKRYFYCHYSISWGYNNHIFHPYHYKYTWS